MLLKFSTFHSDAPRPNAVYICSSQRSESQFFTSLKSLFYITVLWHWPLTFLSGSSSKSYWQPVSCSQCAAPSWQPNETTTTLIERASRDVWKMMSYRKNDVMMMRTICRLMAALNGHPIQTPKGPCPSWNHLGGGVKGRYSSPPPGGDQGGFKLLLGSCRVVHLYTHSVVQCLECTWFFSSSLRWSRQNRQENWRINTSRIFSPFPKYFSNVTTLQNTQKHRETQKSRPR